MTKDEVIVVAGSLAFTCVLLCLCQLIFRGRKRSSIFIVPRSRDDGDSGRDDFSDDWPSEIAIAEEHLTVARVSSEGATNATRAGIISALALLFLCAATDAARAQQTIFNVPTTDVLDRGKVYFELDASFKPNDSEAAGRFSSFVPRVVVGAGGYDFTRNVVAASNRAGGQFGFEQPVSKTVTLAADYFTGKHAAGYFTPGVVFKVGPKVTGYAGYSVGNQNPSRGNHFFLLEFGYNFN